MSSGAAIRLKTQQPTASDFSVNSSYSATAANVFKHKVLVASNSGSLSISPFYPSAFITAAQNCSRNLTLQIALPSTATTTITATTTTTTLTHMSLTCENAASQSTAWNEKQSENALELEANQTEAEPAAERQKSAPDGSTVVAKLNAHETEGCNNNNNATIPATPLIKTETVQQQHQQQQQQELPQQQKQPKQQLAKAECTTFTIVKSTTTSTIAAAINESIVESDNVSAGKEITSAHLLSDTKRTSGDAVVRRDSSKSLTSSGGADCATQIKCADTATALPKALAKTSATASTGDSLRGDEDNTSKSSDTSAELTSAVGVASSQDSELHTAHADKPKSSTRLSERAKKKSWYNVLYPNYKARSEDFKKLFKEVPNDERLIVEYSCALQRDILVQGRIYVSPNYVCFHANIFRWETYVCLKWKDVTSITKEKTALVIPNAITICTTQEKYFFTSFVSRDKSFLMLFRVWQNTLMNKSMLPQEIWQWVHTCYGDELGLTTDDEDYIDPTSVPPVESEVDSEFVSALEDNSLQRNSSASSAIASNSRTSLGISETLASDNSATSSGLNRANAKRNSNSNSGYSSTGSHVDAVKTKTKTYFFSSHRKNSVSASGSDNKTSDCNNRAEAKAKIPTMKVTAKELTLESAKASSTSHSANGGASSGAKDDAKDAKDSKVTVFDSKRKAQSASKLSRQREESASKNSELSPTDTSDSSDSDENKMPFVATAECTSPHEGRQFMHTILPIHIDTLFNLLFSKSKFLVDFHDQRKSTDMTFGEWTTDDEGHKQRIVNVTVQLSASVGPKTSKVTEAQEMRECSKPGELYSIDINSVNAGIPYADSFSVLMHYCLVRTVDDHTMLSIHAQIKYKKSIWGVVKGFIEKNTWAGLEDFYTALLHALQSETCVPPAKGKGRRPRRGTAAQIRPLEEAAPTQAKTEPAEHASAASAAPTHPSVGQRGTHNAGSKGDRGKSKWLSVFVIVMLGFLILLNVILLLKLWKLESRIDIDLYDRARMPNLATLKNLPNTNEDWVELLRQQEILHETELRKWHTVLQTAIELLKKAEKTLAALLFR